MNHISDIMNDTRLSNNGSLSQNHLGLGNPQDVWGAQNIDDNSKVKVNATPHFDKEQIKSQIYKIKDQLDSLLRMVSGEINPISIKDTVVEINISKNGEKIIEGVFNGEKMVGPDGQEYAIPVNYASKSKLVEGDMMKLTITNNGKFIYKQIGPVERKRLIGKLFFDEETQLWFAKHDDKQYKILTASVTFYKGKPGDEVIILIPEGNHCDWAAVENIFSL